MIHIVKCPSCSEPVRWTPTNRFRPFCSARCKQLDLGAWAMEKYRISPANEDTLTAQSPPYFDEERQ